MTKKITISVVISLVLIVAAVFLGSAGANKDQSKNIAGRKNIYMENGKQIIEITARGGYFPKLNIAQKGLPTIIRIKTDNTYDCSSSVSIPKIGLRKILQPAGVEDIAIAEKDAIGELDGLCGMGMYNFKIDFK